MQQNTVKVEEVKIVEGVGPTDDQTLGTVRCKCCRNAVGMGTIDFLVISEPLSFSVVRPSVRPSVCSPLHRFSHNSGIIITLGSLKFTLGNLKNQFRQT